MLLESSLQSSSLVGETGPQVLLRVRIPLVDSGPVTSTIKVPTQMYLADVLDRICRRRKEEHLSNPKEWVLMMADRDFVIPLDRTVESLQGAHQLRLARKKDVAGLLAAGTRNLQNTNPNASIFKHLSEPAQPTETPRAPVATTTNTPTDTPASGRSRRARANAPVYNLSKLSGTAIHGKRRANGDIVNERKRRTISGAASLRDLAGEAASSAGMPMGRGMARFLPAPADAVKPRCRPAGSMPHDRRHG